MQLGSKIRDLRLARGLNQRQLAKAAQLTQATVSRIEQGKIRELKSSALAGLAAALDVSVDSLIGQAYRTPNDYGYTLEDSNIVMPTSHSVMPNHAPDSEQINYLLQELVKDIIMRRSFQKKLYKLFKDEIEASLKERQ